LRKNKGCIATGLPTTQGPRGAPEGPSGFWARRRVIFVRNLGGRCTSTHQFFPGRCLERSCKLGMGSPL
jgi:hypothetical protein